MPVRKKKENVNGFEVIESWLGSKGLRSFAFQEETWHAYGAGQSGIVNAPTGFGKTFAVFLAVVIEWINNNPDYRTKKNNGLRLLWLSPLRALAQDIGRAMETALAELGIPWQVAVRNGDTSMAERARQKKQMPEILITTPESMHLLLASKGYPALFTNLSCIAVDEWHELLGSKRGVQVELALSHLKKLAPSQPSPKGEELPSQEGNKSEHLPPPGGGAGVALRIWGISATIGNLDESLQVLLGDTPGGVIVRAREQKKIRIHTILPDEVERFPWAGHLGLKIIRKVLPVIRDSQSTLLFTNVRSHAERWYQALLDAAPDLAGAIALHHSAVDPQTRVWIEEQLHMGTLQVVVCTASLDLGVDFRPVDTVIQVGSPKGIARFLQRAGRSGHSPGEISNIHFVPTHSLEIVEAAALQEGYDAGIIENRTPVLMAYDVLVQYMVSRATGEGFVSEDLYAEVISTHCYADLGRDEWDWLLSFIIRGGETLQSYDDYHRVVLIDGVYRVVSRRVAMRHRMHIGTIVGDAMMRVRFIGGGFIGTIEESFISRLQPGEVFVLAGKRLELIMVKDMEAIVRRSIARNAIVPSWQGGRLPLSANLGEILRSTFHQASGQGKKHELIEFLEPLFRTQRELSLIPGKDELLVEMIDTKDGHHLFVYPFEGRLVHQAMAALLAWRIARLTPITFSIAMNDYGFELLSDQPIPVDDGNVYELFSTEGLYQDLQKSVNAAELGRRKFRDIAVIAGLIFQGYPGAMKKQRHLQNSTSLLYQVLQEHEPQNLLLQQAYNEVFIHEIELERMHASLERMGQGRIVISRPQQLTPFCFPIKVDSLREQLTSEKLEDRIRKMQQQLNRF